MTSWAGFEVAVAEVVDVAGGAAVVVVVAGGAVVTTATVLGGAIVTESEGARPRTGK